MKQYVKIRTQRLSLCLSVAKAAKKAGISPRMAWKIEAGDSVGLKYYQSYIEALGGSITVCFPEMESGDKEAFEEAVSQ